MPDRGRPPPGEGERCGEACHGVCEDAYLLRGVGFVVEG